MPAPVMLATVVGSVHRRGQDQGRQPCGQAGPYERTGHCLTRYALSATVSRENRYRVIKYPIPDRITVQRLGARGRSGYLPAVFGYVNDCGYERYNAVRQDSRATASK